MRGDTAQQSQAERNKANALAFYEMAFNRHQVKEATQQYIGDTYLQHNPDVTDGGQAFIEAFEPFLHVRSKTDENDRGEAVVDIFRFDENGKIVEHWDVIQQVPEKTAGGRGMF